MKNLRGLQQHAKERQPRQHDGKAKPPKKGLPARGVLVPAWLGRACNGVPSGYCTHPECEKQCAFLR